MESIKKPPFSRGVNFTKWFEFFNVNEIPFNKYVEQDFINAKSLGADVVRLPVTFHFFTKSETDHTLEPLLLKYLDTVIDWAEKHQIYLIIDNHSFHPINPTDPNIDKILIPVWEQLARHFKDRSDYLIYEILNEPHHICDERWGEIQGAAIDVIRKIDPKHSIIVGGTDYNSISKLETIPRYKDENLIYTFHFYDPHIFTHQGATWGSPSLASLSGVPFPAVKERIPEIPSDLKGTSIEKALATYEKDASFETLCTTLDKPAAFSKERGVPVFCGEFGVLLIQSPEADRVKWYEFVCDALNKRKISWTCWDYYYGFGLFKTDKISSFPEDLNKDVVRAMGFVIN
jgi:endoglucanase